MQVASQPGCHACPGSLDKARGPSTAYVHAETLGGMLPPAVQVAQSSSPAGQSAEQQQAAVSAPPPDADAAGDSAGPMAEVSKDICQLSLAEEECVVCWTSEASINFQPCGHLCTSVSCSRR